ncbi:MAG: DUF454 domain-containing protein [Bacteroidetes bacterium HGW-Bacteroidetes-11]|jgi:uncharacterized membrane protein YbaN (DUF454 family)|nr:MAG: DUF454 domain-containing protein [Bacteroidetes bacterium HGW-Bacteroidetes-11]
MPDKIIPTRGPKNPIVRGLLIIGGSVSILLGVLGIFLPLLPTTPFLLLASWCFVRSSDKLHNKLMNNKYLGPFIRNYKEKKGITLRNKVYSLTFLYVTLTTSFIFSPSNWWIWLMLMSIGIGVTWHISRFKTLK